VPRRGGGFNWRRPAACHRRPLVFGPSSLWLGWHYGASLWEGGAWMQSMTSWFLFDSWHILADSWQILPALAIYGLIVRLIDWLIDWSIDCFTDWLIDWLSGTIDWVIDWLIDRWTIYRCTSKWNWSLTRWSWRGRRVFGLCARACFASRQHCLRNDVVLYGSHGHGNNLVTKSSPV
jgi:hypothetical protein